MKTERLNYEVHAPEQYLAPWLEVIEVEVERGFCDYPINVGDADPVS